MSAAPRIVAVVPAKDSAGSITETVTALAGVASVGEVLVVDDGSTDATTKKARAAGAWVLSLPENRGKGGAVAAAVAATPETDVYLLVDADTGATAAGAAALLGPVLAGEADMAVGVLPPAGGRGGFGTVRRLAAAGIRQGTGGFTAKAPISGQRAVRGPLLRSLELAPRFGLEVGLTIDAVRAGARVVEVPVVMDHRHTGRSLSGFAHRGRQGADITRALWPRLTSARGRMAAVVLLALLVMATASWSGGRSAPASVAPAARAGKVLLVGLPGLRWDDVGTGGMPTLDRLAAGGAVGAMNVRTRSDTPTASEGYASLGAGSRVHAGPAADAAVGRDGAVLVPAVADIRAGAGRHLPTLPGALGDALHAAGRRTAVVGTADLAPGLSELSIPGHPNVARPAAVALMDSRGVVDGGSVSADELLVDDNSAPFGQRADVGAVASRTLAALAGADVVLVDPGDLERSAALTQIDAAQVYVDRTRTAALTRADELIGRLHAGAPPGTLLLVVSVTPPAAEWRLAPVVASGAGVMGGYLHSPSTRRLGLVTLTDLAPTVLDALGAPVPDALTGRPLRYAPAPAAVPDRLDRLIRLDRDGAWRERVWLPVTTVFIVAQVGLWFLTGYAVFSRTPWVPWPGLRFAAVAVAAFPLATLLLRALPEVAGLGPAALAVLVALDVAIAAVAWRARRRPLSPLAWIFGATVALLVADVATGARLQLAGILGYSPQTASRWFGIGNTAFGVLAGATLLLAGLHVAHGPRRREAWATAAALLAVVTYVNGAPFLGADVGGVVTLVPVGGLALLALAGGRLTWRRAALVGGATAGALGVLTAVDLLRPPESRTHLGRLASETLTSGDGSLFATLARRGEVTLDVMTQNFWTAVTPVIAVLVLVALLRMPWARTRVPPGTPIRVGLLAALAAGLLGMAVNDSGVIVVAMVMVSVGPVLALLALADGPPGLSALLEPAGKPARIAPQ